MKEKAYILGFTLGVTAFFGLLVSGLNLLLREKIELNRLVAEQRVIVELFGLKPEGEEWPADRVNRVFNEKVKAIPPIPDDPAKREQERIEGVYRYYRLGSDDRPGDDDRPAGGEEPLVVFPIGGMGFWDMIQGYMAVNPQTKTIKGLAFTGQKETPGLGARIEEEAWRAQWVGLRYDREDAEGRRVRVVPPGQASKKEPEVEAITGATETSRAMQRIVNRSIDRFEEEYGAR